MKRNSYFKKQLVLLMLSFLLFVLPGLDLYPDHQTFGDEIKKIEFQFRALKQRMVLINQKINNRLMVPRQPGIDLKFGSNKIKIREYLLKIQKMYEDSGMPGKKIFPPSSDRQGKIWVLADAVVDYVLMLAFQIQQSEERGLKNSVRNILSILKTFGVYLGQTIRSLEDFIKSIQAGGGGQAFA